MKYAVIFEQGGTSVGASEDASVLIAEAIAFHIKGLRLDGDPVPEPSCHTEDVLVAA